MRRPLATPPLADMIGANPGLVIGTIAFVLIMLTILVLILRWLVRR